MFCEKNKNVCVEILHSSGKQEVVLAFLDEDSVWRYADNSEVILAIVLGVLIGEYGDENTLV
jgi:hypothetical protein